MTLNQTCQIQGREYRNLASPLSDAGTVQLPYSGEYHNPGYDPDKQGNVHGYDIGGTLAGAKGRDEAIRKILDLAPDADVKKVLFEDPEMTRKISEAQEKGILNGDFEVNSLDGVTDQLSEEYASDEDAVMITVGTYQMARSFLHGAKLEDYVSALVTSEEAGTGNKKTVDMFVNVYTKLIKKDKTMVDYCDDSEADALAAVEASRKVEMIYGKGFKVYLVKKDAKEEELGENEKGYIVIRNISEKRKYEAEYKARDDKNDEAAKPEESEESDKDDGTEEGEAEGGEASSGGDSSE